MPNVKKFLSFILPIILRALLLTLEKEVQKQLKKDLYQSPKPRHDSRTIVMEPFIFPVRDHAVEVLDRLKRMLKTYHSVTVEDLHDLLEMDSQYSDSLYGWRDLSNVKVTEVSEGIWGLYFPVPVLLSALAKGEFRIKRKRLEDPEDLSIAFGESSLAQELLDRMRILTRNHKFATVADFYEQIDAPHTANDMHWGWTEKDLSYVNVIRKQTKFQPDEFTITMPNPTPIYHD